MNTPSFSPTQIMLLAAPPVLLATTYVVFRVSGAWLGAARGYLVGFLFYWICWCLLLPLLTVGMDGFRQMFGAPQPLFGRPNWLGLLLLLVPIVASVGMYRGALRGNSLAIILASALFSLVNGTLEEVLWRGTYTVAFPDSWLWGVIYPSIFFGLWHLSPQVIHPYEGPGGPIVFAVMPIFLGLIWGWVARTTGSIRWVVLAHILLDFPGMGGRDFLGAGPSG